MPVLFNITIIHHASQQQQQQPINHVLELPNTRKTYEFVSAAASMPKTKPAKTNPNVQYLSVQVGEDAYFQRPDSLGVADGVGGWELKKDVDSNPALISRKMMHYISEHLEMFDDVVGDYDIKDYYLLDPKKVLEIAYNRTTEDAVSQKLLGSTTAIVAVLRDDELRVCNIGDCGLMLIRNGELVFRTEEQQHSFNFPFQLGTNSRNTPMDAQLYRIKVQEGDIVVMGSDGIFDNVFDDEILEVVKHAMQGVSPKSCDPQAITNSLLERARSVAEDVRNMSSPFQHRAIQEGVYYQGGKLDDITILVGIIKLAEDSPDRR